MVEQKLNSDLGYLGVDYQIQLVKNFIEDKKFFSELESIVDQNMFTDDLLRRIVGFMKERYLTANTVPNYSEIELIIRSKVNDSINRERCLAMLNRISESKGFGIDIVQDNAKKFFKQQNLIKAFNKSLNIIKDGNSERYYEIEDIIKKAIEVNGGEEKLEGVFDNIDEVLSPDYRPTIPTGAGALDEVLKGGLGYGELGVLIAPTGTGKAQPLYSKVLTPNGFKTMGEIVVGDEVIGGDGKIYNVVNVYPQGIRPVYRVYFSNGVKCECDINHLWVVYDADGIKRVITLEDIIKNGYTHNRLYIPQYKCDVIESKDGTYTNQNMCDISLLQNWLDNYGVVNTNGKIVVTAENPLLVTISNYARSFGGYARFFKSSVESEGFKLYVSFTDKRIKPFSLDYKMEHYSYADLPEDKISISYVEYIGDDETKCILIDSEDHTYVTDDYIVTHNTSATCGFGANAAITCNEINNNKGYKVLHIFFEDSANDIRRKYYGFITNVEASDLSKPCVKEKVVNYLKTEGAKNKELIDNNVKLWHGYAGEVSPSDIKGEIKKLIAKGFKPDLVIIDYFEALKPEKNGSFGDNEYTREGVTMRKLESIAHEYNIGIWCPIQGTKGSSNQEIVNITDGGGSGKKTQIANIVITFARTNEMRIKKTMNIFVEKFRAALPEKNSFFNITFNNGTGRFDFSTEMVVDEIIDEDLKKNNIVPMDIRQKYVK